MSTISRATSQQTSPSHSRKSSQSASATSSRATSISSKSSISFTDSMPSDFSWSSGEEHVKRNLARFHKKNPSGQYEYVRHSSWQTDYIRKPSIASNFSFPSSSASTSTSIRSSSPINHHSGLAIKQAIPRLFVSPPLPNLHQLVKQLTQYGPICVFIRHCQGEHNRGAKRNGIRIENGTSLRDPPLSDLGKEQAKQLQTQYPNLFPVVQTLKGKFLITNLQRGRDTAFIGWPQLLELENHKMFEIRPEIQENGNQPCDTGKKPAKMEKEYPGIDYSRCKPEVNRHKGIYRSGAAAIRAKAFMKKVQKRKEPILVFVSHGYTIYDLISGRHWKEPRDWMLNNGEAVVRIFSDKSKKLVEPTEEQTMAILGNGGRSDVKSG